MVANPFRDSKNTRSPTFREDLFSRRSHKTRRKMTTVIAFSRQNDTGSRVRTLSLINKLVVVFVLES